MSNILSGLHKYADNYSVVAEDKFDSDDLSAIKSAKVVNSQYEGKQSVCMFLVEGGQVYLPCSINGKHFTSGTDVTSELPNAKVLTLHRDGNADIQRIEF